MPLLSTKGAASASGLGFTSSSEGPVYIEDIFATHTYTGTSASLAINNGIDLSSKAGLVWIKWRSGVNAFGHALFDTVRGPTKQIALPAGGTESTESRFTSFNSNGFTLSGDTEIDYLNDKYVSWTFQKKAKFFDIVTYTGNGTAGRTVAHNLGSTPGCVIVKSLSSSRRWAVYHRGNGTSPETKFFNLNKAVASATSSVMWNDTAPSSTVFTLGSGTVTDAPTGEITSTNENGVTYVAYLFAHEAGGFGLAGTDNGISCGSYAGTGAAGNNVTLGYEPQWVMIKRINGEGNWNMVDTIRGLTATGNSEELLANSSAAEQSVTSPNITSTGFALKGASGDYNGSGNTYIYIAIRRGPMKTPESGTEVFATSFGTATKPWFDAGFPVDMAIYRERSGGSNYNSARLIQGKYLLTESTAAEDSASTLAKYDFQEGYYDNSGTTTAHVSWMFRRAPGFFDVVCYSGTGSARTISHNLAAVPEMMIVKKRSGGSEAWYVYSAALGNTQRLVLNTTTTNGTDTAAWNSTTPTASVFTVGTSSSTNQSLETFVAYLFSTCSGVSKVGSYTGTATTLQIDCGFTAGARFVLIKRTDSTGDWYVWDTTRGIVSGNDPYLLLNSTAAEVTNTDYIDTYNAGFEISSTAPAAINASGGSFIFLAIS